MAALVTGFRETLEAAAMIAMVLALVSRLGRRNLAPAVWYGLGAGLLMSFAVGTGLAAANVPGDQGLGTAQPVMMALAAFALVGLIAILRRGARGAGVEWLASLVAFLAVTPQGIELMGRATALESSLVMSLIGVMLGMFGAVLLSVLLYEGLLRVRRPQLRRLQLSARRLAPVKQEAKRR